MFKKYIRVGNIEARNPTYLDNRETKDIDIVCWEPNSYYSKEDEYLWDEDGIAHPRNRPYIYIYPSCFKNPETCYTVATFIYNEKEPCYNLTYTGFRPFELSEKDAQDFSYILKYLYKVLKYELKEDD